MLCLPGLKKPELGGVEFISYPHCDVIIHVITERTVISTNRPDCRSSDSVIFLLIFSLIYFLFVLSPPLGHLMKLVGEQIDE